MSNVIASLNGRDSPGLADPITARYADDAARIAAIALFGLAILWPIICVALHGYTLTGVFEESVGYRYFYSLRKLYDPPTYLFTAQGQSIDIIQALIQIVLTWLKFPATQVQPRIDNFCYASMIVFQLLNLSAFAWMIWCVESLAAIVVTLLFWLVPFYEPHLSGMYTLLQPDYMTLECALALVAAGSILRTHQSPKLEGRQVVFFGAFVGLAASTKITFLAFPAGAFAFAALQERAVRSIVVKSCQVGVIALLFGLLIAFADMEWHVRYVLRGAKDLMSFMAAGSGSIVKQSYSWPVWFARQSYQSPLYLALVYATPVFALIALLISRTRKQVALSVPLLLIATGSNYFLYKRDYPNSLIEAAFFFQLALFVLVPLVLLPRLPKNVGRAALLLEIPIAALLCVFIVGWYSIGVKAVVDSVKQNTEEQKVLAAIQKRTAGKHIWLVPTNLYRPFSIDSAIMKGRAVGNSQIMRAMFPNRDYRFQDPTPLHLQDYGAVLFVAGARIDQAIARISSEYSIDLSTWRCRRIASLSDPNVGSSAHQNIVMCTSNAVASGT